MLILIVHWYACIWYMIIYTSWESGTEWLPPMDLNNQYTNFF
jgi:hypothetical protein